MLLARAQANARLPTHSLQSDINHNKLWTKCGLICCQDQKDSPLTRENEADAFELLFSSMRESNLLRVLTSTSPGEVMLHSTNLTRVSMQIPVLLRETQFPGKCRRRRFYGKPPTYLFRSILLLRENVQSFRSNLQSGKHSSTLPKDTSIFDSGASAHMIGIKSLPKD